MAQRIICQRDKTLTRSFSTGKNFIKEKRIINLFTYKIFILTTLTFCHNCTVHGLDTQILGMKGLKCMHISGHQSA